MEALTLDHINSTCLPGKPHNCPFLMVGIRSNCAISTKFEAIIKKILFEDSENSKKKKCTGKSGACEDYTMEKLFQDSQ